MKGILTWHSVDKTGSVISATGRQLEAQLDALAEAGVEIVPLSQIEQLPDDVNAAALTFDDGFLNFYEEALPILESRGLPATVFVVAGYVGTSNDWETGKGGVQVPSLSLMSWDQLGDISGRGFEIGAHSVTHPKLDELHEPELTEELTGSLDQIRSRIGVTATSFAFPFGNSNKHVVEATSRVFQRACTTVFSPVTYSHSRHELPRLDAYYFRDNDALSGWGSMQFNALVAGIRAKRAVRSAIQSIGG